MYCQIEKEAHELEYHYFKITDYYKAYVLAKAFEKHMNFNEQLSLEELYDLLILAISSGYFEKPECVKMRYSQLVRLGKSMISISEAQGIVLRAQSEIINIDYWELNIPGLAEKIDTIIKQIPPLHPCDNEDLICAYLNLLNRQMVVALLVDDFEKAERIYQKNLTEIKRLNKQEYVGYLYMDYAKGLYNHNPTLALQYMKQAQIIFQKLGTECRRLLDCSCEVEYLKCITSDENNFTKLESAAQELLQAQYQEIYSKAKLKIAALKLVRNTPLYSEMDIQQDLYLSEYILTYPATGRLRLLQIMVKNAFLIYTHQTNKIIEYTIEDKKIIAKLGNCYNQIWSSNEIGTKRSVQFWNRNTELNVYYLDARIW